MIDAETELFKISRELGEVKTLLSEFRTSIEKEFLSLKQNLPDCEKKVYLEKIQTNRKWLTALTMTLSTIITYLLNSVFKFL